MRFLVDQNLGTLTKWLRFLGFDVVQIKLALAEAKTLPPPQRGTVILTRQTALPKALHRPDLMMLTSDDLTVQLTEICRRFNLAPKDWEPLIRCSRCNAILEPIPPEEAEGRVPDFTSQRHREFFECPACRRVFWEGSHRARIRRRLQELQKHILAP
jgi:uncharacterized protein with PIN domain